MEFAGSVLTALMKILLPSAERLTTASMSELQPQRIDLKRLSRRMTLISLGYQFGC